MARPSRLRQMLAPVALDLADRHDVGLADQASAKAAGLHLMAKRRGPQPELGGGFGERQHGLRLAHQVGLDLREPALHRLAPALVGTGPDLVGIEAVGVPARRQPGRSADNDAFEGRTGELVCQLADDARVKAYEILGDRERAVSIMERRLRS